MQAMRRYLFLSLVVLLASTLVSKGQARFITHGKIEFEKKVNMWKSMEDNEWSRPLKDKFGEYSIGYQMLYFNDTAAVYKMGRENPNDSWKDTWSSTTNSKNVIYQNFDKQQSRVVKEVYDQTMFVSDSLLPIEWHLQDEIREIAGFDCRKAVGKLYDSLYVVAFFTDQILLPSGPEQFNGLPGTILGLAFPRFHTTWFATKVELTSPTVAEMQPPVPGKRMTTVDRKKLIETVKSVADWGTDTEKQRMIWTFVLM